MLMKSPPPQGRVRVGGEILCIRQRIQLRNFYMYLDDRHDLLSTQVRVTPEVGRRRRLSEDPQLGGKPAIGQKWT